MGYFMIGYVLKLIRISNDIDIKKVAEITGMNKSYISDVEHCKKKIFLHNFGKIC